MPKFTPGDWILDWGTTHTGQIATVHHTSQREGWAEIWSFDHPDEKAQTANAQLIAKAPEMYNALKEISEHKIETSLVNGDRLLKLKQIAETAIKQIRNN